MKLCVSVECHPSYGPWGAKLDYDATIASFRERLDSYLESTGDHFVVVNRTAPDTTSKAPL